MGIVSVGQSVPRHEDPRLLRGEGRYTADIALDRQVYGYTVRSPHAHARITGIDRTAAAAAPGVLTVLIGADYAADGLGEIPVMLSPAPGFDKDAAIIPPRLALATDKVRMVGDGVAFIVAETLNQAKNAADLLEIEYQLLDAVTDTGASAQPGASLVWEGQTDNRAFTYSLGDPQATQAAFASADKIVSARIEMQRLAVASLEGRTAIANFDQATGKVTFYVPVQGAFATRVGVAKGIFDMDPEDVRIITGDIGGSFGLKSFTPEMALTLWAAKRLGRPVKWVNERQDSLLSDHQGRGKISQAELALDANGKFLGLRVTTTASLGAYFSQMGMMHTTLSTSGLVGVYDIATAYVTINGYFSNAAPTGPYRGAGRPDASYVIERLIDIAAAETGIDRLELRRRNLIPASAMPYKTALGPTYDSGDFAKNMETALTGIDAAEFESRRAAAAEKGKLLGLGIANNIENAGAPGMEFADISFDQNGVATLAAGTTDHGQGHATLYSQIMSERLGIDPEEIVVREGDTDLLADGRGTGGSRVSAMGSGAVMAAVDVTIVNATKIAAHQLETAEADISFDAGLFQVRGTDRTLSLREVVTASFLPDGVPQGMEPGLSGEGIYKGSAANFPNGCHAVEVEIDRETGRAALTRYVASHDVGRVLNPLLVNGQVTGGIAQSVGQALLEAVVYDPSDGQLLSGSFLDYCMPRASDFCHIDVIDNPTPTSANPLGAKGVGEVGAACAVPAVVNAVMDALSPFGVTHLDTPLTSAKLWRAMQ